MGGKKCSMERQLQHNSHVLSEGRRSPDSECWGLRRHIAWSEEAQELLPLLLLSSFQAPLPVVKNKCGEAVALQRKGTGQRQHCPLQQWQLAWRTVRESIWPSRQSLSGD